MSNILIHSLTFAPDGVSTAYLLTDLCLALQKKGYGVKVLTTTPHNNVNRDTIGLQTLQKRWFGLLYTSTLKGIEIWHIKLPMKGSRSLSRIMDYIYFHAMSLFVGFIVMRDYDIVFTPSPPLTIGFVGWCLSLKGKTPFVYNVQELYPDYAINQGYVRNKFVIAILKAVEGFIYKRSTKIVTISVFFESILRQRHVPVDKICVIPNFVDLHSIYLSPRDNEFTRAHNLKEYFIVFYGGNIGTSQDWESLLFAAKKTKHLPLYFIITGDGVQRNWLEKEFDQEILTTLRFSVIKQQMLCRKFMRGVISAPIPMKPMTTIDTFPSKVYTIMAYGKAVLAQADENSELWQLIKLSGCGEVIIPGDSQKFLEALLHAFYHRKDLIDEGECGRKYVTERYSKEIIAQQYDLLFTELINKQSKK